MVSPRFVESVKSTGLRFLAIHLMVLLVNGCGPFQLTRDVAYQLSKLRHRHLEFRGVGEYEGFHLGLVELNGKTYQRMHFKGVLEGTNRILEITVPAADYAHPQAPSYPMDGILRETEALTETSESVTLVIPRARGRLCHPTRCLAGLALHRVLQPVAWTGRPQKVYLDYCEFTWRSSYRRYPHLVVPADYCSIFVTYAIGETQFVSIHLPTDDLEWFQRSRFGYSLRQTQYLLTFPIDVVKLPFDVAFVVLEGMALGAGLAGF